MPASLFTFWTASTRENIFFLSPSRLFHLNFRRPRFHKSSSWRPKKVEVRERATEVTLCSALLLCVYRHIKKGKARLRELTPQKQPGRGITQPSLRLFDMSEHNKEQRTAPGLKNSHFPRRRRPSHRPPHPTSNIFMDGVKWARLQMTS